MYFPNAFKKSYLVKTTALRTSGSTADLTSGQVGFFDSKSFAALSTGGIAPFIFAQGSWFAQDKIGPVHGGYKESVKTKTINPKYISRVIKVASKAAKNSIIKVTTDGELFKSDNTYRLRLDIKGSPALRFLSHNLYRTLDAFSGCDAVAGTTNSVDPVVILNQWADQVNGYPLLKDFIQAKVYKQAAATTAASAVTNSTALTVASGTGIAVGQKVEGIGVAVGTTVAAVTGTAVTLSAAATIGNGAALAFSTLVNGATYTAATTGISAIKAHLDLAGAYVDTTFSNATFAQTDKYDLEPLFIYASFVDDSGEACAVNGIFVSETQVANQASGVGESVLRDLILDGKYRQEAFPDGGHVDSLRMREIEANPVWQEVNRGGLYDQVLVLHNVPRFNNPSSTFDNDQYLITINVPAGTATTSITDFLVAAAAAAQGAGAVTLESAQ